VVAAKLAEWSHEAPKVLGSNLAINSFQEIGVGRTTRGMESLINLHFQPLTYMGLFHKR